MDETLDRLRDCFTKIARMVCSCVVIFFFEYVYSPWDRSLGSTFFPLEDQFLSELSP